MEELPVRLEFADQSIYANTENISCGGMFLPEVNHGMDIDVDDEITAFLTLPSKTKTVKVNCHVSRVQRQPDSGIALEFRGLYDENIQEIDTYIKNKPEN